MNDFLKNNFESDFKTINGLKFRIWRNFEVDELDEQTEVVCFLYGLLCSFDHYEHQITFLHEQDRKIILMDFRGHHSLNVNCPIEEINFKNITSDFLKLFDLYGLKNLHLIGHSMGVNIALNITLELMQANKPTPKSLILISGTVFPPQNVMFDSHIMHFAQPILESLYEKFPKVMTSYWKKQKDWAIVRKFVHTNGFNPKKVSKEFIKIYLSKIARFTPKLFFQLLNEMRDHHVIGLIHDIQLPTLIISGDQDKIIPLHLQKIFHEHIEGSELYIVSGGNHVPQLDDTKGCNERIQIFYEQFFKV
ncbi:MAG: alpha/beta fold hydrolase [Bacteriovoracaceae bacterium]